MTRRIVTAREQAEMRTPWLPHRLNPDPTNPYDDEHYNPDRPKINWSPEFVDQPTLPHPNDHDWNEWSMHSKGWPKGQESVPIHRGLRIDMDHPMWADHPHVQGMKRILYGDPGDGGLFGAPATEGNLHPHPDSPEGKALSNHLLNFMEDVGQNVHRYREDYSDANAESRVDFTKVHDKADPTWMGRHWTTDPDIAEDFAHPARDKPHGRGLSVMVSADWDGRGEDLSRANAGGSWNDEKEINLVPGAQLKVHGLGILHHPEWDQGADWHNVLSEPQMRTARRKEAEMPPVTLYTKPDCVQCDMTKKRLVHHGIPHQVIDVTQDPAAYDHVTNNLGYTSAPVVQAGDDHWSGFKEDRIKGLLG